MSDTTPNIERVHELLSAERLGSLSAEEAAELEAFRARFGADAAAEADAALGELLVMMDQASGDRGEMPADLAESIILQGRAMTGSRLSVTPDARTGDVDRQGSRTGRLWMTVGIAASFIAIATLSLWIISYQNSVQMREDYRQRLATMRQQIEENATVLARARERAESLEDRLAEAARREIDIAQRLAEATESLDQAELVIARYEAPVDPAELKFNREKLLEIDGTFVRTWTPFDLPDAPAEQRGRVQGDVVWNDELETGYLRFVGLEVNDPTEEQYQVWVIDERGLEQKVSGGVFNATADGEVIVPIQPGIEVGRVALFAITIEEPGGTWVPDLERRVVVAPRDDG